MPVRAIKRNMTNCKTEIIGHKKTVGHGIVNETSVISSTSKPVDTIHKPLEGKQSKFLKIKIKPYISFD
jgi:hypothetical protein